MAKLKERHDPSPIDLTDVYDPTEMGAALQSLYSEMGVDPNEGGQVKVYVRKLTDDGREARLWEGPPEEYNLTAISKRHGSGEYVVAVHGPHTSGRMVSRGKANFVIQLDPQEDARLKMLREGVTAAQGISPQDIARAVAEAVKAAIPQPAQGMTPKEMIELARMMQPQQSGAMNPLEMMKMLAGMAREMGDEERPRGSNGYDLFMRVVDKFGPMFAEVMQKGMQQPGAMAGLPAPIPPVAGAPAQTIPDNPENEMGLKTNMAVAYLVDKAKRHSSPETYAEMAADNLGDTEWQLLTELANAPDWLPKLKAINPEVENHVQWFMDFLAEVREIAAADDGEPEASLTDAGNTGKTH